MITVIRPQMALHRVAIAPRAEAPAAYWSVRFIVVSALAWAASFVIGFQAALAIHGVMCAIAAIVGLRRPVLGLLGISVLCTLDPLMRSLILTGGLLRFYTLHYWLMIVILLSLPFVLQLSNLQTRLFLFLSLLLGLQLIVSPKIMFGLEQTMRGVILFGLIVYGAYNVQDDNTWFWVGVVNGVVGAIGGLVYFYHQSNLPYTHYNDWAFFPLTALFTICVAALFAPRRWQAQLGLPLLALTNVAWIFLSGSRSRLLIGIICLVFLAIVLHGRQYLVIALAIAALLSSVIATQFSDLQAHSLQRFTELLNSSESIERRTSARTDLVIAGWEIFRHHPLGVGTGGYAVAWIDLGDLGGRLNDKYVGKEKGAHAAWVKVLAENGVFGIALLAAFVVSFAVVGWRRDRKLMLLGLFTTIVLGVTFTSTEFQYAGLWLFVASVMCLLHRDEIAELLNRAGQSKPVANLD